MNTKFSSNKCLLVVAISFVALASQVWAPPANAGVHPGEIITLQNAEEVKDLLSPGTYYKVSHGSHRTRMRQRSTPLRCDSRTTIVR
jgi:hypothetical protein